MKLILITITLTLSAIAAPKEFGEKISLEKPISLEKAINTVTSKEQLIQARVTKVCKTSGCWMSLQGEKEEFRVTFSDYGTKVPVSLIGKSVLVQGKITKKTLTLEQTKHYIEDEGGDASKVTEPRVEYRIVASGVKVIE